MAAASLTSLPPAVDLTANRASVADIVDRFVPVAPRLRSPEHDTLALPQLQARLDAEASEHAAHGQTAFVPGSGELPPRNAADVAWSEFNHHWAGLLVIAIGILALMQRAGLKAARHWPLLFVGLALFLFLRADPEVWPLGSEGFFASFRDVEVLQHRLFEALIAIFGLFEWRVQSARRQAGRAAFVFPLITAIGGALLLTHSHALANDKEQLLIELSHTPLAVLGIAAGWGRWLELRLDPPASQVAGWTWPVLFLLIGLLLLDYREA
jgi:putative copper resistance protein D